VLVKAFKYFDLQNTGFIEKKDFLRVIEKIGLPINNPQVLSILINDASNIYLSPPFNNFAHKDFYELFDYYDLDHDGKLKYKEFIGVMYNNATSTTR
jgi:Ca2+-binding EF-hand superfamily protein